MAIKGLLLFAVVAFFIQGISLIMGTFFIRNALVKLAC